MIKNRRLLCGPVNILKSSRQCGSLSSNLSSNTAPDVLIPESSKIDVASCSQHMQNYFRNRHLSHVFQNVPQDYLKRYKHPKFFTIIDPKIARRIAHVISSRLDVEYVVECDPGLGFMSEILVLSTPYLRLCELNNELRFKLNKLKEKYAEKIEIVDMNFNRLIMMMNSCQKYSMDKIATFFENIPKRSWENDVNGSFVVTVMNKRLIRDICRNTILNENLKQCGRLEYYCLMPMNVYQALSATSRNESKEYYRSTAVLFQVIFDHEVLLDGIPRKVILPWPTLKMERLEEQMLVIRAIPKIHFLNTFRDKNIFRSFLSFINDNVRKNKKIIYSLENYVANCGPHFIMNYGLSSYSEFVELSPQDILLLFLELSKLPGFAACSLCSSQGKENNDVSESDEETDNAESVTYTHTI